MQENNGENKLNNVPESEFGKNGEVTNGQKKSKSDKVLNVMIAILSVLLAISLLFNVFCRMIIVKQSSMEPTIHDGQTVVILKNQKEFQVGDVIVFYDKQISSRRLIKRVVALPGDTVSIVDGVLIVENGEGTFCYDEFYLKNGNITLEPTYVPDGCIFVLGDNRKISLDSSEFGAIPVSSVEGRVIYPFIEKPEQK